MIKDFSDGILNYFKVFSTARQYGLWKYLFFSGFITILVGFLMLYFAYVFGDNLGKGMFSWYKWDFGSGIIDAVDDWIGSIIIGIFALIIFKYIVLIVASPFMSYVSEQLERQMDSYPAHSNFSLSEALSDLKRGIVLNVRNFIREMLLVAVLFLLGLIPLLTIFVPILIFIVQAYYAGFGNLDYFLERHFKVKGSVAFVKRHRFLAIGNGAVFLCLLMIPVIGWFIAPFFGTISSTLAAIPRLETSS